jgi:hypothetical protein
MRIESCSVAAVRSYLVAIFRRPGKQWRGRPGVSVERAKTDPRGRLKVLRGTGATSAGGEALRCFCARTKKKVLPSLSSVELCR